MEKNKLRSLFCWITSVLIRCGSIICTVSIMMTYASNSQVFFKTVPVICAGLGLYAAGGISYIINRIFDKSFNEEWKRHNKKIHSVAIDRAEGALLLIYMAYKIFQFYRLR